MRTVFLAAMFLFVLANASGGKLFTSEPLTDLPLSLATDSGNRIPEWRL